ncbi:Cuticle protein 2 [Zootermopsis nevadensis]|uniref:Cuticle protein 2 n=2 Tax=Zootermopsis nevadensis TaxID=136037 RepID=A0A067R1F3_ZOONE|nr:Cuticle protein 2 [Zootermopsis nevadensis]
MNKCLQVVFFCLVAVSVAYARPGLLGYPYGPILPQPVADTPEVAAAKASHFAAYNAAAAAAAAAPDLEALGIPVPLYPGYAAYGAPGAYIGPLAGVPTIINGVPADTPEVALAKAAHFAAHAQANAAIYG